MMERITIDQAESLMRRYAPSERVFDLVWAHCKRVASIACRVAQRVPRVDLQFVETASLLHDIGRFTCPPKQPTSYRHGYVGCEILMKEGLPLHANVCKVHLGIGMRAEDVVQQGLDLPAEDMVPSSVEEMIITYSDNLDFCGEEKDEKWVEERFTREINEEYGDRVRDFHRKIHELMTLPLPSSSSSTSEDSSS
eukprot:TRINITY_DN5682_c0_g1_i8.p2 TRINITY_DN5682_c0_g1~~TRINITY_DN5682_c0_g1_i8.p2  ORF type:complete len:195 (+),score=60.85 TRINITY_DN5682_c0_g1_i8:72-656(+)